MRRWIDVDPMDWFYRDVIDATRLTQDLNGAPIVEGIPYGVFESGYGRIVKRFVTIDGQREFLIPSYTYHVGNPIYVLVNGIEVAPESVEDGKITLSNPMTAGIEVVCVAFGRVLLTQDGCVTRPAEGCSNIELPYADLRNKAKYMFSLSYKVETATVLGVKLKRVIVDVNTGDDPAQKILSVIGANRDQFAIHKGRVYVPQQYKGFPVEVGYNYLDKGVVKFTTETVMVDSLCVRYNDRFFPNQRMKRADFLVLIHRLRVNLYNRFTDGKFQLTTFPQRYVADRAEMKGKWYETFVLDTLEEKFLDGCYVFPLYSDDKFEPDACVTRAEVVTYLNRFIEWSIERFR